MPHKTPNAPTWAAPEQARLLTIEQLCEWAQITPRTLRKLWSEGCGPRRVQIGGSIRIRWADAQAWADSRPVEDLTA